MHTCTEQAGQLTFSSTTAHPGPLLPGALTHASCLLSGTGSFEATSPSPRGHTRHTPWQFSQIKERWVALGAEWGIQSEGVQEVPGWPWDPGLREAHQRGQAGARCTMWSGRKGTRGTQREQGMRGPQGQPPVTWHHRQHCPHHLSCPLPLSSGHLCSVSALFSSSRTSLSSAPR